MYTRAVSILCHLIAAEQLETHGVRVILTPWTPGIDAYVSGIQCPLESIGDGTGGIGVSVELCRRNETSEEYWLTDRGLDGRQANGCQGQGELRDEYS